MSEVAKEWLAGLGYAVLSMVWLVIIAIVGIAIILAIDEIRERRRQ